MGNRKSFDTANMIRGTIISNSIILERAVDTILACYFTDTDKKYYEILDYMLSTDRILFENKRRILEAILKDKFPDLHKKYKPALREIENQIIPIRNRFAHYHMEYPSDDDTSRKIIGLVKIKDGRNTEWFTIEDLANYTKMSGRCNEALMEILDIFKTNPTELK